uniref:MCL1 apoptosis regulator, BCL2 family member n=1 Tax=Latimeria chalumnae TaxID=7897 RepID=H3AR19_LATCH
GYNADGSVPPSPPTPSTPEDGDGDMAEFRKETLKLLRSYLCEVAGCESTETAFRFGLDQWSGGEKPLDTLRRVGDSIIDKHRIAFNGMQQKLNIHKEDDLHIIPEIGNQIFKDGATNWGRIVSLIAFGAVVAKKLKKMNLEDSIEQLAVSITDFLVQNKGDWILKNQGWKGFVDFFHVEDAEGTIKNVLMTFAGVAGLGASLVYLMR